MPLDGKWIALKLILRFRFWGKKPYHAVFIRAPLINRVGKGVEILASLTDGTVVAAKQQNILVSSFHPELTDDFRFHQYFLDLAGKAKV